ncbi:MAG: hypothetical protein ABI378_10820 [Chitinophagaceae bacterium]
MTAFHPQYIKDENGKKSFVVLSASDYQRLLDELEMMEDVQAYDAAKAKDDGTRIPASEVFAGIEAERKNAKV